jgi:beta-barrel assembly-enhancing protease
MKDYLERRSGSTVSLLIRKRTVLVAIYMVAFCGVSMGQDFDRYKTLLPKGPIPRDFTEQSSVKVAEQVTSISERKARVKKAKKKFVLESTYGIDDFLASGNVLFNDEISIYLDNVLKELLKPYPDLQKKIRVYAVKSSAANAFTTNDGMIFVNLGLLSRLENEAQLAFILSHEIVHYQKKHVINAYITNVEIDKSKGDYRKLSMGEKGFAKSSYAKELETEADIAGADIYAKSAYILDSVEQVFNVLRMADYPVTQAVFNKQIFESGLYVFPDSVSLKELTSFDINEDYDDSDHSHPSIKKRRDAIREKFAKTSGGSYFNVSKTRFFKSKNIAQFEVCRLYLLEHRFTEALTLALSLQGENPASAYLRETIAKSLYGIAKQTLRDESAFRYEERWVGEPERIAHFVKKQSSYELSVLAIRELYRCKELAPDNQEISLMVNDLMADFGSNYSGAAKNFLRASSDKPLEDLEQASYTQYAFLDLKDKKAFFQLLEKQAAEKKTPEKKSRKRKRSAKPAPLNISKVVVVNPVYRKLDTRKKQRMRHVDAEKVLTNINDKILNAASALEMKTDIINPNRLTSSQVALMQDNSIMNDWIDEQMRSGDNRMISPIYNEVLGIADAHKTDHFAWMGGFSVRHRIRSKGWAVIAALIAPAITPVSAVHVVRPQGKTMYFALVFDVRKQELEMVDLRYMGIKDSELLLQSNIYYTLFKLKK